MTARPADADDAPTAGPAPLRWEIFTLFPEMFGGPLDTSILSRAVARDLIRIALHNIRDWTSDRHHTADDTPYGGGAGMVMLAPPIVEAVEGVLGADLAGSRVIALSPAGTLFTQELAGELATASRIALICGHYEGIDDRVMTILGAEEISIGDYVLTGGELAAAVIVDAVSRLRPGVIDPASVADDSHGTGLVEYPHYTRPDTYRGLAVPDILLSGHHAKIAQWRREQAIRRTARRRPQLLARAHLTEVERDLAAAEIARPLPPSP